MAPFANTLLALACATALAVTACAEETERSMSCAACAYRFDQNGGCAAAQDDMLNVRLTNKEHTRFFAESCDREECRAGIYGFCKLRCANDECTSLPWTHKPQPVMQPEARVASPLAEFRPPVTGFFKGHTFSFTKNMELEACAALCAATKSKTKTKTQQKCRAFQYNAKRNTCGLKGVRAALLVLLSLCCLLSASPCRFPFRVPTCTLYALEQTRRRLESPADT